MNELIKINNKDGVLTVSSRQVANDFEKEHKHILDSIDQLVMGVAEKSADLFIPTVYSHEQNKQTYREYLLTRDGFSLLVMGFTGQKALQWKLKYIDAFNKMEQHIKQQIDTAALSPELQMFNSLFNALAKNELEQKRLGQAIEETKQEIQEVREVIEVKPSDTWRADTNNLVKKICFKVNDYKLPKENIYKALEERAGCDLKRRLENMKGRVLLNGSSKSKADQLNYLDVIAEDKKLIEIYAAIVKEMAIKYAV